MPTPLPQLITEYKLRVKTRILDKNRPNSISLMDETSCWWELADLFLEIANRVVNFNSDRVSFTTTDDVPFLLLDNYHDNYYPLYGNNPFLFVYDAVNGQAIGDFGIVPQISYVDDDPEGDISSVLFDFSRGISGYLQISGEVPTGVVSTTAAIDMTFSASNLLDDGQGGKYLPNSLLVSKRPLLAMSNGNEVHTNYSKNSPAGLYGFDVSSPQTIIVTVI